MGASRTISRAYKCALALSICIQLEVFFYIASVGCFLDEIIKGLLGANPQQRVLFIVGYALTSACVIPWLYLVSNPITLTLSVSHLPMQAWYGIRRESKRMMAGFFILSILYLGISGATFSVSDVCSRTIPVVLTPSRHVVEYLPADLRVLDTHRHGILNFLGSTSCNDCPGHRLHAQLWQGPPSLL